MSLKFSLLRKIAWLFSALTLLLFAAWLSFPAWAPWLAETRLPEGWEIERLDVGRPRMAETAVAGLTATGRVGMVRVMVEASDLSVRYEGPVLSAGLLRISLAAETAHVPRTPSEPPKLDELALPRLVVPGGFPEVVIRRLELDTDLGDPVEFTVLEDIRLGREAEQTRLSAGIGQLPLLAGDAVLEVALGGHFIELTLAPGGEASAKPLVVFRQETLEPGDDSTAGLAQATIEADLDLQQVRPGEAGAWLGVAGLEDVTRLSGNIAASVRFEGREQLRLRSARLELIQAAVESAPARLTASGKADAMVANESIEWRLEGFAVQADGILPRWRPVLQEVLERAGVEVRLPDGPTALTVEAPASIEGLVGARPPYPMQASGGLDIDWRQAGVGRLELALGEIRWQSPAALRPAGASITAVVDGQLDLASGLSLPGAGLGADRIEVKLKSLQWPDGDGEVEAMTTGLQWTVEGQARSGADLDIRGRVSGFRRMTGSGDLLLGALESLPFRFEADLDSLSATLHFENAALPAAALPAVTRPLAVSLPRVLTIESGEFRLDGRITLRGKAGATPIDGRLAITGDALSGAIGKTVIDGLGFEAALDLGETLSGGGSLGVEATRLAAGIDLLTVNTRFETEEGDRIRLLGPQAGLLGGTLESDALSVGAGGVGDFVVRWSGFELGRLLEFVDLSGLDGTGRIDARFPVINEPGGLAVREGAFEALGPGRIRYRAALPATNIGMRALENFEYESLAGTIDYASDGAFRIMLNLLGRNPDLYGGHPIRFRLNIGGELPAAFRSMFITGDFEQAIIEQLRNDSEDWPGQR
jgi:hypothetical protein